MLRQDMIPRNLLFSVAVMIVIAIAMGVYAWHVRIRVANVPLASASGIHVAPPAAGPTEQVTVYVAHDNFGTLKAQVIRIPLPSGRQERAEELLRDLITLYDTNPSPHPLGPGSELRSVYLVDPDLAVIDVNAAFATGHPSGVLAEELTVTSLIESLSANVPGIGRVKILVDGKTQDTLAGHADLTEFYDVRAIHQLAQQLEAGP
ncbi:MAG: GerMN domain-containing protein [Terriglobales bacterium]